MASSERQFRANTAMEINARLLPPSLHGTFRQLLHGGDFGERKPAEKFQVDHCSELRLDFRQLIQGVADQRELLRVGRILNNISSERGNFELTTSFNSA